MGESEASHLSGGVLVNSTTSEWASQGEGTYGGGAKCWGNKDPEASWALTSPQRAEKA